MPTSCLGYRKTCLPSLHSGHGIRVPRLSGVEFRHAAFFSLTFCVVTVLCSTGRYSSKMCAACTRDEAWRATSCTSASSTESSSISLPPSTRLSSCTPIRGSGACARALALGGDPVPNHGTLPARQLRLCSCTCTAKDTKYGMRRVIPRRALEYEYLLVAHEDPRPRLGGTDGVVADGFLCLT